MYQILFECHVCEFVVRWFEFNTVVATAIREELNKPNCQTVNKLTLCQCDHDGDGEVKLQ
jgi:hypothetical protein